MTAEYWRERAEEARTKAEQMFDREAKATLLQIALSYDKLADRAEANGNLDRTKKR
jgi:hypothetical protein